MADLERDGVASTSVEALLGSAALLEDVLSRTDDLIADQSADIVRRRRLVAGGEPTGWAGPLHDPHAVELLGAHPPVDPEDPYTRFLRHAQVAGVAGAYCRRDVRVLDMNGLLTLAAAPVRPTDWARTAAGPSLEVALHLTGVDEGTGPLHYVRASHRRRGARRVRHLERSGHRLEDPDLLREFGDAAHVVLHGGAGTVVFFDPRGLHRTGRPTTRDRLVLHGRFATRSADRTVLLPADAGPRSALADSALA